MRPKNKKVLIQIQEKRERMIDSAKKYGFTSEVTIRFSQELDELIYEYQCILKREHARKEKAAFIFKKILLLWPNKLTEDKYQMYH